MLTRERILALAAEEQYQIPFADLVRKIEESLDKRGNDEDKAEAEALFNRLMRECNSAQMPGPILAAVMRLAVASYDYARAYDPTY